MDRVTGCIPIGRVSEAGNPQRRRGAGATAQVPPLSASVTVSTRPVALADPTEQLGKLFSSVTTGDAGTVKPLLLALNVTTT